MLSLLLRPFPAHLLYMTLASQKYCQDTVALTFDLFTACLFWELKLPPLLHWLYASLNGTMNQMPKMQTVKFQFSTSSSQRGDIVDII